MNHPHMIRWEGVPAGPPHLTHLPHPGLSSTAKPPPQHADAGIQGGPARGCECHSDEPLTSLSAALSVGAGPGHRH